MTKAQLWSRYVAANPSFDRPGNVTMSAAGLRKLFEQTWDVAHEQGVANGRSPEQMRQAKDSTFSELFGGLRPPF